MFDAKSLLEMLMKGAQGQQAPSAPAGGMGGLGDLLGKMMGGAQGAIVRSIHSRRELAPWSSGVDDPRA